MSVNARNLEKQDIYINKFMTGLNTNRSPLFSPLSSMGLQVISRYDTLWDGLNMDISHQMTLVRRWGFTRYCSASFNTGEYPLNFYSFKNTQGVIKAMVDTNQTVGYFTTSGLTALYTKGTTTQTSFVKVGSTLFMCDGVNTKKWNGTTLSKWGIVAPVAAPTTTLSTNTLMTVPVNAAFSGTTTGGSLAPGNYYYRIAATNSLGTTVASVETGIVVPTGTSTNTVTVNWGAVTNATGYKVYGRTGGAELLMATIGSGATTTFVDNGSITPSGALPTPQLTTVNGGYQYVYVYQNSTTGHTSTASPVSVSTGNLNNQTVTVHGASSSDSQIDKVTIFRTLDGGANYYFLATISNGGSWTYTDTTPDSGLNVFITAPQADANDPPPANASIACFHMGKIWLAAANFLYFSGDTTFGVTEESFPPANVFTLPGNITAMASTSSGLVVWTSSDAYVVTGIQTASFVCQVWQSNLGVPSQNCVCQDGDMFFLYTTQGQLFQFSSSLAEIGSTIQANLAAFNPANVYLTLHRAGIDEGLFITDGSTNMYRYSVSMNCWSTVYQPVGGVNCVKSIEVTTASYRLMMGRPTGAGFILARDTTAYADDGSAYPAFATIGSLTVAPPRQHAAVESILLTTYPVGTFPTVSLLVNEISGTFVQIGVTPNGISAAVPDPWELPASKTVSSYRLDLTASKQPIPKRMLHMQVKLTFATEAYKSEVLTLTVS